MNGTGDQKSTASARSTGGAVVVRAARRTDFEPLVFFFDTILRKDYFMKRGQLRDMLEGQHHRVHVAEIDCVLVGVAIQTARTRLVNVLIHPAYRGLGIGRELIQTIGVREVRCKLDMSTGDPQSFYQSLGFEPTGEKNDKGNIAVMRLRRDGDAAPDPGDDEQVKAG
jgi:ribosomal protein S18 acetylase RimI-like enzyme